MNLSHGSNFSRLEGKQCQHFRKLVLASQEAAVGCSEKAASPHLGSQGIGVRSVGRWANGLAVGQTTVFFRAHRTSFYSKLLNICPFAQTAHESEKMIGRHVATTIRVVRGGHNRIECTMKPSLCGQDNRTRCARRNRKTGSRIR